MHLLVCLIVFSSATFGIYLVNAACNTCGYISGVACISQTQFQECSSGVISSSTVQVCPDNMVCTNSPPICVDTATAPPDCFETGICGVCSFDQRFACLNSTTFAYCFGTMTPSTTALDNCPVGQYCNSDITEPGFCSSDPTYSTCSLPITPPTTTIPASPPTPQQYCATLNSQGRFPTTWVPSCNQYVYCFMVNGIITGQYYQCQGTTVFNPVAQLCVVNGTSYTCTT